jgi:hypothetical protein
MSYILYHLCKCDIKVCVFEEGHDFPYTGTMINEINPRIR